MPNYYDAQEVAELEAVYQSEVADLRERLAAVETERDELRGQLEASRWIANEAGHEWGKADVEVARLTAGILALADEIEAAASDRWLATPAGPAPGRLRRMAHALRALVGPPAEPGEAT
jgi:chromosome segregation ATPase